MVAAVSLAVVTALVITYHGRSGPAQPEPTPTPAGEATSTHTRAAARAEVPEAAVPTPARARPDAPAVIPAAAPPIPSPAVTPGAVDPRPSLPGGATASPAPARSRCETIVVEAGDTLWAIAKRTFGDPFAWPRIVERNRGRITDPDLILTGDRIVVGGACPGP